MRDWSRLRLSVVAVVVLSLVVTLGARLFYLQVLDKNKLVQTANRQHTRQVVQPAPRGAIVDDAGRPLADNHTALVIAVDTSALSRQADKGTAVLRRLSGVLGVPLATLRKEITPCARGVPKPCWTGPPVQPVPVATHASDAAVLRISEHREEFPGIVVDSEPVRQYPRHAVAGHEVGYVSAVTQEDIDTAASEGRTLGQDDSIGRSGLEQSYDNQLRGTDGIRTVSVDNTGTVTGTVSTTAAKPGDTLVTSLDANIERIAQDALNQQIATSRATFDPKTGRNFAATSGAVVVMDPTTGRVIALASDPSYDPNLFIGGISQQAYARLTGPSAPMVSRAVQGQYAPGSTFKLSTASAITMDGQLPLSGTGSCPPSLEVGNQRKTNYDSESLPGQISLREALAFSCDTFFYRYAMDGWYADENRIHQGKAPAEALQHMAREYGFGSKPGIDLPAGEQSAGRIVDRATLKQQWEENKAQYCANAKRGYPEVTDAARRAYLTELAKENCTDGWRYRIGEAADLAIGQGETTVSPLQLADAYCALVNGGTLYQPTIGKAIVNPYGRVVRTIDAKVRRHVPVSAQVLDYIKSALQFGHGGVSGEIAFTGWPFNRYPMSGKTGTAEVFGKQDTSWFASWSNAGRQHYVVVGMIEQGGLGAKAAAPMVRKVYEGIYGLGANKKPAVPGGQLPAALPHIAPYAAAGAPGDIVGPDEPNAPMPSGPPSATTPTTGRRRRRPGRSGGRSAGGRPCPPRRRVARGDGRAAVSAPTEGRPGGREDGRVRPDGGSPGGTGGRPRSPRRRVARGDGRAAR